MAHATARLTVYERRLVVARVLEEGWSAAAVADAAGISRATVYKWLRRHQAEGAPGLEDRSSRPHRSPRQVTPRVELRIRPSPSAPQTRTTSHRRAPAPPTIDLLLAVLRRHHVNRLDGSMTHRNGDPAYERERPGELVHMDTKKLLGFHRAAAIECSVTLPVITAEAATTTSTPRSTITPAWRTPRSSRTNGPRPPLGSCFVPWTFTLAMAFGWRRCSPTTPGRTATAAPRGSQRLGIPSPLHPTAPTSNQRQGGALQPNLPRGVGLRPSLPQQRRAQPLASGVAPPLQLPPVPHRARRASTHRSCQQPIWELQLVDVEDRAVSIDRRGRQRWPGGEIRVPVEPGERRRLRLRLRATSRRSAASISGSPCWRRPDELARTAELEIALREVETAVDIGPQPQSVGSPPRRCHPRRAGSTTDAGRARRGPRN